jgi:hypothetical protein
MKVGDLVRTKQTHHSYGYKRPACIIVAMKKRVDGTYCKIMDSSGDTQNWWPEELELVSEDIVQ